MMTDGQIPIPSQIIEILGEKNAADIFTGDSTDEDSDFRLWPTKVYALKRDLNKRDSSDYKRTRSTIYDHLVTFQKYYYLKHNENSGKVEDSTYESNELVATPRVLKFKTTMPRTASPRANVVQKKHESDSDSSSSSAKCELNNVKREGSKEESCNSDSDQDIIPATQQTTMSGAMNNSKGVKLDSTLKSNGREKAKSSRSSDSDEPDNERSDDENALLINKPLLPKASPSNSEFSDSSDDERVNEKEGVASLSKTVSHRSDSEDSDEPRKDDDESRKIVRKRRSNSPENVREDLGVDKPSSPTPKENQSSSDSDSSDGSPPSPKVKKNESSCDSGSSDENPPSPKAKKTDSPCNLDSSVRNATPKKNESSCDSDSSDENPPSPKAKKTDSPCNLDSSVRNATPKKNESSYQSASRNKVSPSDSDSSGKIPPSTPKKKKDSYNSNTSDKDLPKKVIAKRSSDSGSSDENKSRSKLKGKVSPPVSSASKMETNQSESSVDSSSDSEDSEDSSARKVDRPGGGGGSKESEVSSRKRKADSISSSSDDEPRAKVRKTVEMTDKTPFNSTKLPGSDDCGFPGGDISVIPKSRESTKRPDAKSSKSSSPPPKTNGSSSSKTSQLSIREFAKPINPVSQTPVPTAWEALRQEYTDSGCTKYHNCYGKSSPGIFEQRFGRRMRSTPGRCHYASLIESSSETFDGFVEEDLLDEDLDFYVVQCPKEVDLTSLVGHEFDLSNEESAVDLSAIGGQKVRHDVYCDLTDSKFAMNVIIPSRTKKKFALKSIPVSGRLTIVESVDVPKIEEFDDSSPPPVPFPENLKQRNTLISGDSLEETKANQTKSYEDESSCYITKRKKKKKKMKLEENEVDFKNHEKETKSFEDESSCLETKRKKKKMKHEENNDSYNTLQSTINSQKGIEDSADSVSEDTKRSKKKKKKKEEALEIAESDVVPVEETVVKKKKKKKKNESELNDSVSVKVETLHSSSVDFQNHEKETKSFVDESSCFETKMKKKKKKMKLEEDDDSYNTIQSTINTQKGIEDTIDSFSEDPNFSKKKKKKKKHRREEISMEF